MKMRLNAIANETQRESVGAYRLVKPGQGALSTDTVDKIIPIFDMVVGIFLIIGLLTPVASIVAALFLLSVVLSQMPGYPGTAPTYFQAVECLALLVLAATDAGRYAGLDFIPWAWWNRAKTDRRHQLRDHCRHSIDNNSNGKRFLHVASNSLLTLTYTSKVN